MANNPRIILHVGAHKTATTYLQNRLDLNQDKLSAAGIYYPHIFETRRNFTYRMKQPLEDRNAFTMGVINRHKAGEHILLSDENFIGGVDDVVTGGKQYGFAEHNLRLYLALIESETPEIYFCVRDYASFIVSMYCEYLRHFPYVHFDVYYRFFKASAFSWVDTINAILTASPGATLKVWEFSRFRELEPLVLKDMTGIEADTLAPLTETARDSFSDTTIRCIDALSTTLDFDNLKKATEELSRIFPKGDDHPKYSPLSRADIASLNAQYQLDIEQISAMSDRLVVLGSNLKSVP